MQQLQKDHVGVQAPDRRRFSSFDDALQRLLPYHVFQGAAPSQEFSLGTTPSGCDSASRMRVVSHLCPPSAVDEEFEDVAAQVLNRTCAMVNKYRRLLMVEAEVGVPVPSRRALTGARLTVRPSPQRSSPSSEMVMIERTFNTEERRKLTQDKRLVLVDPGGTQRGRPVAPLPLTPPLLPYRRLPGGLLLRDEIQTVPGPAPVSVLVQLHFQPV